MMQAVPASPQGAPSATWFERHRPLPLQLSAASQAPLEESPHVDPAGSKPLSAQRPFSHESWRTHALPASPQEVPSAWLLARHRPVPLQASGFVHSVSLASPQAVPAAGKPLS